METTIETNNNDEVNMLRIKLEIVEKELQLAINRAEKAESDIAQLKSLYKNKRHVENALPPHSTQNTDDESTVPPTTMATTTAMATETPTSLICTHCGQSFQSTVSNASSSSTSTTTASVACTLPPPPPPPMPNFKPIPVNLNRCGSSLKDGITAFTINNPRESGDNVSVCSNPDVKKSATGRFIRYCRDDGGMGSGNCGMRVRYVLLMFVCLCVKRGACVCMCTNRSDAIVCRVYTPPLSSSLVNIAKHPRDAKYDTCVQAAKRHEMEKKMPKLIKLCRNVLFFCRMLFTDSVKTCSALGIPVVVWHSLYTCVQLFSNECICLFACYHILNMVNLNQICLTFHSFFRSPFEKNRHKK